MTVKHLKELLKTAKIVPAVNQARGAVCKRSSVQEEQCARVAVCKRSSVQEEQCARGAVCKRSSVQE
jgi:hypothetical protein